MSTLHEIATKIVAAWDAGDKQHLRLLMELLRHALAHPPSDTRKAMEQALLYIEQTSKFVPHTHDQDGCDAAVALRSALAQGVETDTTRLEFMQFYGAQVCWGNDSEVCDVRWHTHWGEQELRRTSNHNDWRVAIDEAIEMEKKP